MKRLLLFAVFFMNLYPVLHKGKLSLRCSMVAKADSYGSELPGGGGGTNPSDPIDSSDGGDPCSKFSSWVQGHPVQASGTVTYYDLSNSLSVTWDGTGIVLDCSSGTLGCISSPRYWAMFGGTKWYWNSNQWNMYIDCSASCLPISFDYTRSIPNAPANTDPEYSGKTSWCAFASLQGLNGTSPCTSATYYYANYSPYNTEGISGCNADFGTYVNDIPSLYAHFGQSLTQVSSSGGRINGECDLITALNGGNKVLVHNEPGHTNLVYGIHRDTYQTLTINLFSTDDPEAWDQPDTPFSNLIIGGPDYVTQ